MAAKQTIVTVASPPAKPLLIYDGECNFCKFWILRWQKITKGKVEYIPSQELRVTEQFPELAKERFETSVVLIETDGRAYSGADAVFRSLSYGEGLGRLPWWLYRRVAGFAPLTEWIYRFVARHRAGFSSVTRLFWGKYE